MAKVLNLLFRVPLTKPYCNLIVCLKKLAKIKIVQSNCQSHLWVNFSQIWDWTGASVISSLLEVDIFHKWW